MTDWALLESVEGLEGSEAIAGSGALWELLQGEKEKLCREISAAGPFIHGYGYTRIERDPSDECSEAIEWRRREQLEQRLRDIVDAQDRLHNHTYGRCADCGEKIDPKRLEANPIASLCISCQRISEPDFAISSSVLAG